METWISVWVYLASFLTLARVRFPSSGILVAMRLPPHSLSLPLKPLLLRHHRRRRRRHLLLPLPTVHLHHLLRRRRAHNPLQRLPLLRLFPLRQAAVRLYPRAPLILSRELPSRREAHTTPVLTSRLANRTSPTWLRLLSTWERWFASLANLVREGRCFPVQHWPFLARTDGGGLLQCENPGLASLFANFIARLLFDFSGLSGGRFLW